jgi:hypothetical protein
LELSAGRASPEAPREHPSTPPPGEAQTSPDVVEWTVSPWRENRGRAALALMSALLLWILAARLLPGELLLSSLLGLAALGALAPGMAPMQCRVDGGGVGRRVLFAWDRRPWAQIRRARVGTAGLFVSPFARPCRLDRYRSLLLPVPRSVPDGGCLLERLRREVARHGL